MNILRLCVLPVIVLLSVHPLTAQVVNNDAGMVWKRQVARLVDTRDSLDAKGYVHKKEYGDTILAKLLIDAVMNDKITAYKTFDASFSNPVDKDYLKYELYPHPDTISYVIGDSVREFIQTNEFKAQDLSKYRILEEWVFDPHKRRSEITILGVCLLKDVYGIEGDTTFEYRGSKGVFCLKWKDVRPILNEFMTNHPGNNLQRYLWDSHFMYPDLCMDRQSYGNLSAEKIWTRHAVRDIETLDTNDWDNNHLRNENERWTICESFYDSIKNNRLIAYNNSGFEPESALQFDSIGLRTQPDTQYVEDIAQGNDELARIIFRDIDWGWFCNYNVLEKWSFDSENGKINIHLLGIEPRFDIQNIDTERIKPVLYKHMFWVRYKDVIDILDHYDEYHPLNNLSTSLWRSYFKE